MKYIKLFEEIESINESESVEKHTEEVLSIIDKLNQIKSELSSPEYIGWGLEDMERIINKSVAELGKLPRLIKNNAR